MSKFIGRGIQASRLAKKVLREASRSVVSTSPPANPFPNQQWINPKTNEVLFWNPSEKEWLNVAATSAAAAQAAADAAQTSADANDALLDNIAADDKITPVEKLTIKPLWDTVAAEKAGIDTQADSFSVSKVAYGAAYDALNLYLNTTLTVFADMTATTDIVRATWDTNWDNYWNAKVDILQAIADETAKLANWSTVVDDGAKPADNATVGATFGSNIAGGGVGDNQVGNDGLITTITHDTISTTNLAAINADLGSITAGNITLDTSGFIRTSGKDNYADTTAGVFIGYDATAYKVNLGNDTDYLKWTGSAIELLCSGANAITIEYGSDILLKHGGDIKFTSVTAPTACTGALAGDGAGNLDNGEYHYKITFVNEAGETELGSVSNTVTVVDKSSNGKVALSSIPTSSSGSVTARRIYRTLVDDVNYYLVATISDNATTTYTDNISDATIEEGGIANDMKNSSFGKLFIDSVASLELSSSSSFLGQNAGFSNATGDGNTFLGSSAGYGSTHGEYNTFVGFESGYANARGSYNTFVGYKSGYSTYDDGSDNTFIGYKSGYSNTVGYNNTFIGYYSGYSNIEGKANAFLGYFAGQYNSYGDYNTLLGHAAGFYNTSGDNNTFVGYYSGLQNSTGNNNIGLGHYAGRFETGSNAFYVNNQNRTNTAGDKSKSILYGVMAAAAADQTLRLNASVGINTADFGSGKVVLAIANASTVPSANPTGGGVLYCQAGALKFRGSSGTITTIANA